MKDQVTESSGADGSEEYIVPVCPRVILPAGFQFFYPHLNKGPCEDFNATEVKSLISAGAWMESGGGGKHFLDHLEREGLLKRCLNLRQGVALTENPILVRKFFYGMVLFLWQSACKDGHGMLWVPAVVEEEYVPGIRWHKLDENHEWSAWGLPL